MLLDAKVSQYLISKKLEKQIVSDTAQNKSGTKVTAKVNCRKKCVSKQKPKPKGDS
jgi:hypothetical protein